MFEYCDQMIKTFEEVVKKPVTDRAAEYFTGVDLGTSCVVMVVLNEKGEPVAGDYKYADVVRDGMVVDYVGAIRIVTEMKQKIEKQLNTELLLAAAAIPPGTDNLDGGAVRNIVQAAGFDVINILDEPSAANNLLHLDNGAIVDIGGGTTGISIVKNAGVQKTIDEATGGVHFSLVISGAYKMPFKEAEKYKMDFSRHKEIFPVVKAVIDKISTIITNTVEGEDVDQIILVGGSSCLTGIEKEIEKITGIRTFKPHNPMFVTPIGIALSCIQ